MRILLLKNKKVIDLENKQVSSWNYIDKTRIEDYGIEEPCYEIYYFNRDIGEHIEQDDKGGQSMDSIYESQIQKTFETLEDYCAYQTVTITLEEYNELTKAKEELASKNEYIRKLLMPFVHAKVPLEIFEKIQKGECESEVKMAEFPNYSDPLIKTTHVMCVYKIKSKDYLR